MRRGRSMDTKNAMVSKAAFFKQSFELKIKGDLIPEVAAQEDHRGTPSPVRPTKCRDRTQREGRFQADQGIPHGSPPK